MPSGQCFKAHISKAAVTHLIFKNTQDLFESDFLEKCTHEIVADYSTIRKNFVPDRDCANHTPIWQYDHSLQSANMCKALGRQALALNGVLCPELCMQTMNPIWLEIGSDDPLWVSIHKTIHVQGRLIVIVKMQLFKFTSV